jgi:hypothetical protein
MTAYQTAVQNVATNAPVAQRAQLLSALDNAFNDPNATQASIYAAGGQYSTQPKYEATTDVYGNPITYNASNGTYVYPDGSQATPATSTDTNPVVQSTIQDIGGNVTPSMSVAQAISTVGTPAIVSGLIGQEGGSPNGVVNNPGNIKYEGLPGQINSGVQATDGGTFASYATLQAGQSATEAEPITSLLSTLSPITVSGIVNGSNRNFTVPSGVTVLYLQDGDQPQMPGVSFNQSGTAITFTAGNAPSQGLYALGATAPVTTPGIATQQIWIGWALSGSYVLTSGVTRNSSGALLTANVTYPDGTQGIFTTLVVNATFPNSVDSYTITNSTLGRTLTQPTVTRESNGFVVTQPAIIIT